MALTHHVFFFCLIAVCISKPVTLYSYLNNEKIEQLRVLRETNPALKQEITLKGQKFQCWKFLENNYIIEGQRELHIADPEIQLSFSNYGQNLNAKEKVLAQKLDRLLSLLHGTCAYHQTSTFVYEFCHLESIRQFDNTNTYFSASKRYPQDINMGIWNLTAWGKRGINVKYIPKVVQKDGVVTQILQWPSISDIQNEENNRDAASALFKRRTHHQYDQDLNVIHFQAPMPPEITSQFTPDLLKITCTTGQKANDQIVIDGMIIGRYTIVPFSKDVAKCKNISSLIFYDEEINYYSRGRHPLRVVNDVLYGDVFSECINKQAYGKYSNDILNSEKENYIDVNTTLILKLEKYPVNDVLYLLGKVQSILGQNAIRLHAPIGTSFKRNGKQEELPINKVASCSILTHNALLDDIPIKIEYLGNNVIKIEHRVAGNHPIDLKIGQDLFALSLAGDSLIGIQMQVIAKIADGYYHIGYSISKDVEKDSLLEKTILNNISIVRLLEKVQKINKNRDQTNQKQKKKSKATKILHLTAKNNIHHFSKLAQNLNHRILIISPQPGSIVSVNSNLYSYIMSSSSLQRIKRYPNESISLVEPDEFYLNNKNNSSFFLYVDQSNHGGIWRLGDKIFIPRLEIRGETIESVEVKGDSAIVRVIQRGEGSQDLTVSKYNQRIKEFYNFKDQTPLQTKQPTKTNQNQKKQEPEDEDEDVDLLELPMKISYNYTFGEHCAPPINRFRSTKVTFTCRPSFLEIIDIEEPQACTYHMTVGTRLLCGEGKGWFQLASEQQRYKIRGGQTICLKEGALKQNKINKYSK